MTRVVSRLFVVYIHKGSHRSHKDFNVHIAPKGHYFNGGFPNLYTSLQQRRGYDETSLHTHQLTPFILITTYKKGRLLSRPHLICYFELSIRTGGAKGVKSST